MRDFETRGLHQLPLGADPFEEHDQVEAEEDDRIDRGATAIGVPLHDPVAHDREIQGRVKLSIEVVGRDELLKGNGNRAVEGAMFGWTEHE
jgi:hypothetical protein